MITMKRTLIVLVLMVAVLAAAAAPALASHHHVTPKLHGRSMSWYIVARWQNPNCGVNGYPACR